MIGAGTVFSPKPLLERHAPVMARGGAAISGMPRVR
jgi:hypothetical protein